MTSRVRDPHPPDSKDEPERQTPDEAVRSLRLALAGGGRGLSALRRLRRLDRTPGGGGGGGH
jgi:hypothetical protein